MAELSKCSFCKKTKSELQQFNYRLVSAPNTKLCICDNCSAKITLTSHLLPTNIQVEIKKNISIDIDNYLPKNIYNYLDQYVMFQDKAKKTLSLAAYQHLKRNSGDYINDDTNLSKSNILLVGGSGTGKTLLVETLANLINVPFVTQNANSFTSEGYHGRSVKDIIKDLYIASNENAEATERGIVFIDEIDKLAGTSRSEGVNSINVQQSLLKLIEGTKVFLDLDDEEVYIDTKNILFICAGAFDGIDKIAEKRNGSSSMGFGTHDIEKSKIFDYSNLMHQDINKYGFIDELLGRLPILVALENLDDQQYLQMLTEPKNSLVKQLNILFEKENSQLKFTDEALLLFAKKSRELKLGARGARTIITPLIEDILFDISGNDNESIVTVFVDNGNLHLSVENLNKTTLKSVV